MALQRISCRSILTLTLFISGALAPCFSQPLPDSGRYDGLSATVWFQRSGEFRALCYQAYALARLRLDIDLRDSASTPKRAVVVDIDETILDNSPHQAKLMLTDTRYPSWWKEWVETASAEAIPGAQEFLNYAASKGVDVYYITNRSQQEVRSTLQNLRLRNFPQADTLHLLPRERESSKEARRLRVLATHRIVLLAGDNLNDFATVFDRASAADRSSTVDRLAREFGTRFIVLPNPLYGDWESSLFQYERLSPPQQHERRLQHLRSFE